MCYLTTDVWQSRFSSTPPSTILRKKIQVIPWKDNIGPELCPYKKIFNVSLECKIYRIARATQIYCSIVQ